MNLAAQALVAISMLAPSYRVISGDHDAVARNISHALPNAACHRRLLMNKGLYHYCRFC